MTPVKKLYELQLVEDDIDSSEQAVKRIDFQLKDNSLLDQAEAELQDRQKRLKELKEKQHSFEWEIDDFNGKLSKDKNALYGGSVRNPKELANLQHDVDSLRKRLDTIEEKALAVMEDTEQVEIEVAEGKKSLKRLEEEQTKLKKELEKEKKELVTSLNELENKRKLILDGIDKETYKLYCLLREQKKTAVARLERGACRGCGIAITSAWQQRARSGDLVKCSNCGRILYTGN